jgi:hypothetical protein
VPGAQPAVKVVTSPAATVLAGKGLYVRSGPGTNYPIVGSLAYGQAVQITGKNPDGTWWQIIYPLNSSSRAWISAYAKYTSASNAGQVSVVPVPPPPPDPGAAPTPEPKPVPQSRPVIHKFVADRTVINAGENVVLSWDLEGGPGTNAYLRYDGRQDPLVSPGSRTIKLDKTTDFVLQLGGGDHCRAES